MALIDKLNAIGDAIRAVTGKTDKMTLDEMLSELRNIQQSGEADLTPFIEGAITTVSSQLVTYVRTNAFTNCTNLVNVNLPNVTSIDKYAFSECTNLQSVNVQKAETVGAYAFKGCSSLVSIDLPQILKINDRTFSDCSNLRNVSCPNLDGSVGEYAFYKCSSLNKIDLAMTTSLSRLCFSGCSNLEAVILRRTSGVVSVTDPFGNTPIGNSSGNGYVYVPASKIEGYKLNSGWQNYVDKIRSIEDYPDITGG